MTVAVRPWVKTKEWWSLLTQLPRMVRLRLGESGIEVPYPRSDIAIAGSRNPYETGIHGHDQQECTTIIPELN